MKFLVAKGNFHFWNSWNAFNNGTGEYILTKEGVFKGHEKFWESPNSVLLYITFLLLKQNFAASRSLKFLLKYKLVKEVD
jgi:hypothetical protein